MRVLFIGGTGNISRSVSLACVERGIDLHLLTRGTRHVDIPGARLVRGDINRPGDIRSLLEGSRWDSVVDRIAYAEEDIKRDIGLFRKKTDQFISKSAALTQMRIYALLVTVVIAVSVAPHWGQSIDLSERTC